MDALVTIRAVRDHYGSDRLVMAGETDKRSRADAEYLVAQGIAEIVAAAPAMVKAKGK